MQAVKWFNSKLLSRPKTTEVVSAFILTFKADLICQFIESKFHKRSFTETVSGQRALNLASFRAFAVTPVLHFWYKWLAGRFPGKSMKVILFKSLLDRLTIGPVVLAAFFAAHTYNNGGNLQDFEQKMRNDFMRTNKVNITYWTTLLMFTFKYVPLEFQVLTVNSIGFGWMIYLSFCMNRSTVQH
jgi:protein Mpv17